MFRIDPDRTMYVLLDFIAGPLETVMWRGLVPAYCITVLLVILCAARGYTQKWSLIANLSLFAPSLFCLPAFGGYHLSKTQLVAAIDMWAVTKLPIPVVAHEIAVIVSGAMVFVCISVAALHIAFVFAITSKARTKAESDPKNPYTPPAERG